LTELLAKRARAKRDDRKLGGQKQLSNKREIGKGKGKPGHKLIRKEGTGREFGRRRVVDEYAT